MKFLMSILLVIFYTSVASAESSIVFLGEPSVKINEGGESRVVQDLNKKEASEYKCIITKVGDKYYWTSRENKELTKSVSGVYVTYTAVNGAGYVRTLPTANKNVTSLLGGAEAKFDYVEHLLLGLRSITYYGVKGDSSL